MYKSIRLEIKNLRICQILTFNIYKLNWLCKLQFTLKLDFRGLNLHSRILNFTNWVDFDMATSSNNTKKCTNFSLKLPFKFSILHFPLRALWTTICNIFMFFLEGICSKMLAGNSKKASCVLLLNNFFNNKNQVCIFKFFS